LNLRELLKKFLNFGIKSKIPKREHEKIAAAENCIPVIHKKGKIKNSEEM
jgi:hypothetical protein